MIFPEDIFDFAYFFDFEVSLHELSLLAIPENWKFLNTNKAPFNSKNPILEKYIRSIYRFLATSYNISSSELEKNKLFTFCGAFVCFNTGLLSHSFQSIFALFEINHRRDTKYNWVFKSFLPFSSPKLKCFSLLPPKPSFECEHYFHYDWDVRINFQHILQDSNNLQRIPESIRYQTNLPLLLQASVLYARTLASIDHSIIVPQLYCRQLQFLMPVCLTNIERCDLAMTLTPCNGYYYGATCLTLEMAYMNARIINRPRAYWLEALVKKETSQYEFPYEYIYGMSSTHTISKFQYDIPGSP